MTASHQHEAGGTPGPTAANDDATADPDIRPFPALLSLATLLARREAQRILAAANDDRPSR